MAQTQPQANKASTRAGHRYRDAETGVTLDTYFAPDFARDGLSPKRGCTAERLGLVTGELLNVPMPDTTIPPKNTEDAYFRLYLLSECSMRPNTINLDGLFSQLPNVAWTSAGPVLPEKLPALRALMADEQLHLTVYSIDKFPRLVDYVTPPGVRIADADRVRLGAHLWPGTTVMHEGFVNFNAGSIGAAMIEGRVTPGVIVDEGSDIGAGSSIMGTLSGGGKTVNAVGKRSLLGANAGIGISLGDQCVVEAGLYVTAGTKVLTTSGETVAARELSGQPGLLFRRNSTTGVVEAVSSVGTNWGGLNKDLHTGD